MGMTITEKILAAHAGKSGVEPGELINCRLDGVLGNDITTPVAINEFKKLNMNRVFDQDKIFLVMDHFTPNKDIKSATQCQEIRNFAQQFGITHYYEGGRVGIEHCLLPEAGLVLPGDVIIGADSHTCTYGALGAFSTGVGSTDMAAGMALGECWFRVPESIKFIYYGQLPTWVGGKDLILYTIGQIGVDGARYQAMEFVGEAISQLGMDGRFTMCNMAIEAGGKNGIIPPDETTLAYINDTTPSGEKRARRPYQVFTSDSDAKYSQVYEYDVSRLEPQVAAPHAPENVFPVSQMSHIPVDQAVIGSCTNGRMDDLRLAARILKGHQVHPAVRTLVIPGTPNIYHQALKEGLLEIFIEAGAIISPPTCGPCLGGHMGILAKGECSISTTNRNFVGRMGHPESEVYLANPAVTAASAILGRIASPEEIKLVNADI
jgi:3-isopropylmalate/(R)-2-methylmalate dehydratase large subunit